MTTATATIIFKNKKTSDSSFHKAIIEMEKLPSDVIYLIIEQLDSSSDLKNLRLVRRAVSDAATRKLFSYCSVDLQEQADDEDNDDSEADDEPEEIELKDDEEDDEGDGHQNASRRQRPQPFVTKIMTNLQRILSKPHLKNSIRVIRYITNLRPNRSYDDYDGHDDDSENEINNSMRYLLRLCNKFPKLTSVELEFAQLCVHVEPDESTCMYTDTAQDTPKYRTAILRVLFAALNDSKYPTPNLTTISLKNLQNVNDTIFTNSKNFFQVLKRITNLRMRIVTEYDMAAPECPWSFPPMHKFFAELPKTWLAHCAGNLTSLTIHCDTFWGYFPKCDWRGIHFPKLKKLELGNYTFSHDWQLDWILSHGKTLEVLVLDDCPILRRAKLLGDVDGENYAVNPSSDMGKCTPFLYYRYRHIE